MSTATRYPLAQAQAVAGRLLAVLAQHCGPVNGPTDDTPTMPGLMVCGSIRRGLEMVGDVDMVYCPRIGEACPPGELLPMPGQNLMAAALDHLVRDGILAWRTGKKGTPANGPWIHYMVDRGTGIPVDFFRATPASFWSLVLCRTGPLAHNIHLAQRAQEKGMKWSPSRDQPGFLNGWQKIQIMDEPHAFETLGLPYLDPAERF